MNDPPRYTFEDARRQQLRDGIALSTSAKVAWFEEMVALAVRFGARDRLKTGGGFDFHEDTEKKAAVESESGESRLCPLFSRVRREYRL